MRQKSPRDVYKRQVSTTLFVPYRCTGTDRAARAKERLRPFKTLAPMKNLVIIPTYNAVSYTHLDSGITHVVHT